MKAIRKESGNLLRLIQEEILHGFHYGYFLMAGHGYQVGTSYSMGYVCLTAQGMRACILSKVLLSMVHLLHVES